MSPASADRASGLGGTPPRRILVAAVGNVLRGDDGFGPALLERLDTEPLPAGVRALEVGIGGIALVHALMDGYDALVVVDAVDRGAAPGTLHLLEPEIPDPAALSGEQRRVFAADMHETLPARALLLARAAGVLPRQVRILGCQPAEVEQFRTGLSAAVADALPRAVDRLRELVAELGAGPAEPAEEGRK